MLAEEAAEEVVEDLVEEGAAEEAFEKKGLQPKLWVGSVNRFAVDQRLLSSVALTSFSFDVKNS